jgi:hypothetical protein
MCRRPQRPRPEWPPSLARLLLAVGAARLCSAQLLGGAALDAAGDAAALLAFKVRHAWGNIRLSPQ